VKKALAKELGVEDSAVSVSATESRRLSDASARQLAGTWKIDFTVTAPEAKMVAVEAKVTSLKTSTASLKTELKVQLKAAGVSDAEIAKMEVSSFTAQKQASGTTGTTGTTGTGASQSTGGARSFNSLSLFTALAALATASMHAV